MHAPITMHAHMTMHAHITLHSPLPYNKLCSMGKSPEVSRWVMAQELHPCGAETIFMDRAYLAEIVQGLLRVHVRHAVGLRPPAKGKACNAFVTAAVGPAAGESLKCCILHPLICHFVWVHQAGVQKSRRL